MYLVIDEFNDTHSVDEINEELVSAILDGLVQIFKFEDWKYYELIPDEESEHVKWVGVEEK